VLKLRQPLKEEIPLIRPGSTLISFVYPGQNQDLVKLLAEKKINLFGKFKFNCIRKGLILL